MANKFTNSDGTIQGSFQVASNSGSDARALKNNSGEAEIVAADLSTLSTLKVATPTNADHATTKSYVDGLAGGGGNSSKAVKLQVAHNSAATIESTFQIPNNAFITKLYVKIVTAFDTAATITCGLKSGSATQFLAASDVNLQSTAGTVFALDLLEDNALGGAKEVSISYTNASATAGQAEVYVFFTETALS